MFYLEVTDSRLHEQLSVVHETALPAFVPKAVCHLEDSVLPEKSKIYKIVWLYSDGTQLICINTTYIPEYIYPDLTQQIAASAPAIDLITNNCQITLAKSNQKVTLFYADTKTAQILNIPVDSPLMKYKGLMYDKQGHLAVFFENNMLIDRFGFIREVVL